MWPIYRYDPRLVAEGKNPFQLDAKETAFDKIGIHVPVPSLISSSPPSEVRFKSLKTADPERAAMLLEKEKTLVQRRWKEYKYLSERTF